MLCGRTLACLVGVAIAGVLAAVDSAAPLRPLASLPAPPPAGAQELWETNAAAQTMSSRWFLDLGRRAGDGVAHRRARRHARLGERDRRQRRRRDRRQRDLGRGRRRARLPPRHERRRRSGCTRAPSRAWSPGALAYDGARRSAAGGRRRLRRPRRRLERALLLARPRAARVRSRGRRRARAAAARPRRRRRPRRALQGLRRRDDRQRRRGARERRRRAGAGTGIRWRSARVAGADTQTFGVTVDGATLAGTMHVERRAARPRTSTARASSSSPSACRRATPRRATTGRRARAASSRTS